MRHSKLLAVAACAVSFLAGCQATTPQVEESPVVLKTEAAKPTVLTTATPSALPENTLASTNAMAKLLRDGAQYILYSADPPVTLELPRMQVQITGPNANAVMKYAAAHHCIPLENSAESESANLVTVCLENGSAVLRTLDGMAYAAVSSLHKDKPHDAVIVPPEEKLALPGNISGESDDGEGDEHEPTRLSIIALPQAGDGLSGYRVAEYLVLPLPSKWMDETPLASFAASSGCRLLNPFAAPSEEYALCYVDDALTLVPEADLEGLALQYAEKQGIEDSDEHEDVLDPETDAEAEAEAGAENTAE